MWCRNVIDVWSGGYGLEWSIGNIVESAVINYLLQLAVVFA